MSEDIVPLEFIASKIYIVRGHKVMLDSDLASLYGVTTKNLNQAVSRNLDSFPPDFMYRLKASEQENLRFQIGTSRWGGRRYSPYVFTHNGVSMLSSVLKSKRDRQIGFPVIEPARVKLLAAHHLFNQSCAVKRCCNPLGGVTGHNINILHGKLA